MTHSKSVQGSLVRVFSSHPLITEGGMAADGMSHSTESMSLALGGRTSVTRAKSTAAFTPKELRKGAKGPDLG